MENNNNNTSSPIPSQAYSKQQVFTLPRSNSQSLDNSSSTFYQRPDVDIYQPQPTSSSSTYYPPSSLLEQDEHRIYSFMPLESVFQQKRPRRKFNEIERLYQCNYYNCTKAYGTLNHLNAHISMQEHGPKRLPIEFKDLRKQLRKTKAETLAKIKNDNVTTSSDEFTSPKRETYHGEFSHHNISHSLMTQQQHSSTATTPLHPSPSHHHHHQLQQQQQHGPVQHQVPSLQQVARSQQMATQLTPPQQLSHPRHPPQKIAHIQQMAVPQQMTPPQQMAPPQPMAPPQQQQQFQQNYPPPPPPQPTFQQYQLMQQQQQQQFH
ncbi:hypothetical protein MFLAVUS_011208 [Mucor flavus]|uniref:C2H2-type domain-containing protein n=1 Tax=Mucor flavus TaxID=439312 RepID=A0ABP9ZEW2_9FUNG